MISKIPLLKNYLKKVALIEAILSPDWESRYYSFNSKWSENEELASMRDGQGKEWFLLFNHLDCAALTYFCPDSKNQLSLDNIPDRYVRDFSGFFNEPAFSIPSSTAMGFNENSEWQFFGFSEKIRNDLIILDGDVSVYLNWAKEYYGKPIPEEPVRKIFLGNTVPKELIQKIDPSVALEEIKNDILEIGLRIA